MFYNFYPHTDGQAGSNGAHIVSTFSNSSLRRQPKPRITDKRTLDCGNGVRNLMSVWEVQYKPTRHVSYHQLFVSAIWSLSFTSCSNKLYHRTCKTHCTCVKKHIRHSHSLLNAEYSTCILRETAVSQVTVKISSYITPCGLVGVYRRFRRACCLVKAEG